MKAILIDDEDLSLKTLAKMLERHCPDVEILGKYRRPEEGRAAIMERQPDVVFLDIKMPGMNGFELLESLDTINFDVVFTTAYDEYALRAFTVSAIDYLLKPIGHEHLVETVEKIRRKHIHQIRPEHMEFLLTNLRSQDDFPKLAIPSVDGIEFVDLENITQCVADRNYTIVHTNDGAQYVLSRTLKEIEKLLPPGRFFRTHHSHIVNLAFIKKYVRGTGGELILNDGSIARVSKARKDTLLERIFKR